jgi:hypothetical protein
MKFATFTFDDGIIASAKKVHEILFPYKATFYVVSGWVLKTIVIVDKYNINFDHGTIEDWKEIIKLGHEVGSHTHSHCKADNINIQNECLESLNFLRKIQIPPYSLSCPHHTLIKTELYDSIRTGSYSTVHKKFDKEKIFNKIESLNLFELYSIEDTKIDCNEISDNSWIIFSFHGIDSEGFCPITTQQLETLKNDLLLKKFKIVTVREMTLNYELGMLK